jgi:hypothetical protein
MLAFQFTLAVLINVLASQLWQTLLNDKTTYIITFGRITLVLRLQKAIGCSR